MNSTTFQPCRCDNDLRTKSHIDTRESYIQRYTSSYYSSLLIIHFHSHILRCHSYMPGYCIVDLILHLLGVLESSLSLILHIFHCPIDIPKSNSPHRKHRYYIIERYNRLSNFRIPCCHSYRPKHSIHYCKRRSVAYWEHSHLHKINSCIVHHRIDSLLRCKPRHISRSTALPARIRTRNSINHRCPSYTYFRHNRFRNNRFLTFQRHNMSFRARNRLHPTLTHCYHINYHKHHPQ